MDTVGSRLRFRRKQKKLTQRDVAEWAGVSASAVTQWESDLTKLSGENLILVCKCLRVGRRMVAGQSDIENGININLMSAREVPLISWVQAGNWTEVIGNPSNEQVKTTRKLSDSAFALRVKGDSMTSSKELSIPEGSIVIVEPVGFVDEANGKIVVAQTVSGGEATLKKLAIDPPFST
ncbi:LexA family protein [Enterobacter cloacae complex sp. 279F5]|uniref:LexA family protein n=1 Tax=Enterobacter cloacae complex sp. 279F5 TaxID=3395874 RepID=UPI003CEFE7A8